MSDGPSPFEQMREMRVRASMRAQRERALLVTVAQKAEELLGALSPQGELAICDGRVLPPTVVTTRSALEQALLDYETWKACNP